MFILAGFPVAAMFRAVLFLVNAVGAPAIQEFTIYTPPVHLGPAEVHNFPVGPIALPDWVKTKYAGKPMGVVKFQLDIIRQEGDGEEVRVPLNEIYNHHTIQAIGTNETMTAVAKYWQSADPLGPHPRPHCGSGALKEDVNGNRMYFGPVGGAEYRNADVDLPKPYRAVVDSPEAFVAVLHFINNKDQGEEAWFECPCTSDRKINVTNGTVDGVVPLAFGCTKELIAEKNGDCALAWYKGGYRCCENGNYLSENPKTSAPKDTVYGKFTFRIDDFDQADRVASFQALDVTGHNGEYDIPKCDRTKDPKCIHTAEYVTYAAPDAALQAPNLPVEWVTARGHQHVGGMGMELYNEATGELLCASHPIYGTGSEAGNEQGYMVGVPPCVWGPPPLQQPPRLRAADKVRIVSRYNSTEGHYGVMGFWFMQVALVASEIIV